MSGIIPYIGGKHRLAKRLVKFCASPNRDLFVDVFGGSAAVMLAAAAQYTKLVYNDVDGDLVNLFRVIADPVRRVQLFRLLRALPVSRRIFDEDHQVYKAGGLSFCRVSDPVERARKTLYRHLLAFGGKVRSGGFQASSNDPDRIKEVQRYRNVLRKLARVGKLFQGAVIEGLHYSEAIRTWGHKPNAVLFIDPPYDGSEGYYSRSFSRGDHVFLAEQLRGVQAHVVCTYYRTAMIEALYPEKDWIWESIAATKNCCLARGNKVVTNECVIIKRFTSFKPDGMTATRPLAGGPTNDAIVSQSTDVDRSAGAFF